MKKMILATLTAAVLVMPMRAQQLAYWLGQEAPVDAGKVKYVLVVEAREIDSNVSYAMVCSPERPDCNTVYKSVQKLVPFATLDDVQMYLANTKNIFIKLFYLTEIPVTVKESTTETPQPPLVIKKKSYTIPK